jgi:uncharacterized protein (TIGR04255 family)
MLNIPKRITPCPIANATVEFRFLTEWNVERLRDEVYSRIKDQYASPEALPIVQLPPEILQQDQDNVLRYQPYYKFTGQSLTLQLGPRMVSVSNSPTTSAPYLGWAAFQLHCLEAWNVVHKIGAAHEIERLGLRYVNIFEDIDIFSKICISPTLTIEQPDFMPETSYLRTFLRREAFGCLLQLSNELMQVESTEVRQQRRVSLIDIDVSLKKAHIQHDTISNVLESAHTIEKELFFGLLRPEFLNTLNPEY